MRLDAHLHPAQTLVIRDAPGRDEVLRRVADSAALALPALGAPALLAALLRREGQMPTSTPEGVAFPHATLPGVPAPLIVVARLAPPIAFGAASHPPVSLLFAFFSAPERPTEHLRMLARIARLAGAPGALGRLRAAPDPTQLLHRLLEEDRAHP